jgi:cobalt/nickel transport system permease protein
MGIAGPCLAYAIWVTCKKFNVHRSIGAFLAAALGDLFTYVVTSFQLALAFPTSAGFFDAFLKFGTIFAVTQIPLAIAEGILAVILFDFLYKYKGQLLSKLKVVKLPGITEMEGKQ